jgi:predicted acyltransferase
MSLEDKKVPFTDTFQEPLNNLPPSSANIHGSSQGTTTIGGDQVAKNVAEKEDSGDDKAQPTSPLPVNSRLVSLDVARGLTILLMITANYQVDGAFPQISHAEWFGFTIADSIFPNFVLIMGTAIPLAFNNRRGMTNTQLWIKIIKRAVLLWLFGAFLNGYPFSMAGLAEKYRFVGVLHRLSLTYLVTAILYLTCYKPNSSNKFFNYYLYIIYPISILVFWLGMTFGVYNPTEGCEGRGILTPECSTQSLIDTRVWGQTHNYQAKGFDPEGVLSMSTACLTCWIGLIIGINLVNNRQQLKTIEGRYKKITQYFLIGLLGLFIAYAFNPVIPVGKPLWTATFVACAGGFSFLSMGVLMWAVDIQNVAQSRYNLIRFIFQSFIKFGRNPLLLYMLSEIVAGTMFAIPTGVPNAEGESMDLWSLLYSKILGSWIVDSLGSLIWSQFFVWVIYVPIAWFLDYKKWYLKV